MRRLRFLKLLIIAAFIAGVYLMDMYAMLSPSESVSMEGDGSGVIIVSKNGFSE